MAMLFVALVPLITSSEQAGAYCSFNGEVSPCNKQCQSVSQLKTTLQ